MSSVPLMTGWAHSRFGKTTDPNVETLIGSVAREALAHAEVEPKEVDAIYVGVFNAGLSAQSFEAGLVGVTIPALATVPATRVENACATGSAALFAALDLVQSGRAKTVLVVGAEKMTAAAMPVVNQALLGACYREEEESAGSFAAIFGSLAEQYFTRHGDHRTTLARIAAKNHANGARNPYAHLQKDLGFDFCNSVSSANPEVAGPLRRTDCSMVSDGAAAIVIRASDATGEAPRAVGWRGRAQANDHLPLSHRADPLEFAGARAAFAQAMNEAGAGLSDLSLLETHDCFTLAELLQYEAFGLTEPGRGADAIDSGLVARDGALPVNVSGGLKAKGHPIGATGVSQHVMAAMQITGTAGDMQLRDAEMAGVFNMGGVAATNYFSVLERVR